MSEVNWVVRDQRDTLMRDLAADICARLHGAIQQRGIAFLAVSGGSTVKTLFPLLANTPIDWAHVRIGLVDDRWVDEFSADSNERLVRELLLQNKAVDAQFVPMKTPHASPEAGVAQRNQDYAALPWPCDVMLLGMGEDAHTASLFPCSEELGRALTTDDVVVAVNPTTAPYARMSLSLASVINSRYIVVLTCGASKRAVLEAALKDGPVADMPIRGALRATAPCAIYYAP
ncbi:6-phosphogluconolactonase [Litorivicinus lipolyticus]|nr:6-phosphogluconolactonase [Litorivicinus lipolyticus]